MGKNGVPEFPPPTPLPKGEEEVKSSVESREGENTGKRPEAPSQDELFEVITGFPDEERFISENPSLFYEKNGKHAVHRSVVDAYYKQYGITGPRYTQMEESGQFPFSFLRLTVGNDPQKGLAELYQQAWEKELTLKPSDIQNDGKDGKGKGKKKKVGSLQDLPRIIDVEKLKQADASRESVPLPVLSAEEMAWVTEKLGKQPGGITDAERENLRISYSDEDIDKMDAYQAQFVLHGGHLVYELESKTPKSNEETLATPQTSPSVNSNGAKASQSPESHANTKPEPGSVEFYEKEPERIVTYLEQRLVGIKDYLKKSGSDESTEELESLIPEATRLAEKIRAGNKTKKYAEQLYGLRDRFNNVAGRLVKGGGEQNPEGLPTGRSLVPISPESEGLAEKKRGKAPLPEVPAIELPDQSAEREIIRTGEGAEIERSALDAVEAEYLAAYKSYLLEVERAKLNDTEIPPEPEEIETLKERYLAVLAEYQDALRESIADHSFNGIQYGNPGNTPLAPAEHGVDGYIANDHTELANSIDEKERHAQLSAKLQASGEQHKSNGEAVIPWTAHEGKKHLEDTVAKFDTLNPTGKTSLESAIELNNQNPEVEEKKNAYFTALKKYQKERSALGIVAENFTGQKTPKQLTSLRQEWIQARADYAKLQQESAENRLKSKKSSNSREEVVGSLTKEGKKVKHGTSEKEYQEKVLDRYNRLVILRSVVFGAEEQEREARKEGLSSREKKSLDKALDWYKRQPAAARVIGTSAVMMGGTALLLGSGIGAIALALGSSSAAMRIASEKSKEKGDARTSKITDIASRIMSIGGIAGLLGEKRIQSMHKRRGTIEKAGKVLREEEGEVKNKQGDVVGYDRTNWDLANPNTLAHVSEQRRRALIAEEEIERQARLVRVASSFAGGVAIGATHSLADSLSSGSGTPDPSQIEDPQSQSGTQTESPGQEQRAAPPETPQTRPPESGPNTVPSTEPPPVAEQAAPTPEAPRAGVEGRLEIGDGANELLYELRAGLIDQYGEDLTHAPDYVKHFVNDHSMWERSQEFGFMTEQGSVLVHPGATLSFNTDGELVMNDPSGVGSVRLMDADGNNIDSEIRKVMDHPHRPTGGVAPDAGTSPRTVGTVDAAPSEQTSDVSDTAPQSNQAPSTTEQTAGDVPNATVSTPAEVVPEAVTPPSSLPEASPIAPTARGPISIDEFVANQGQIDPGSSSSSIGVAVPEAIPPSGGPVGGMQSIDEWTAQNAPQEESVPTSGEVPNSQPDSEGVAQPAPEIQPLAATIQPVQGNAQLAYVSAENPAMARELATRYALEHPGTKIVFDNPKQGLFSFFDRPRLSSVAMNPETGRVIFTEQEVDAQGNQLNAIDRNVLGEPSRFA